MDRGHVWGFQKDTGGINPRRGVDHRKEFRIQDGWEKKPNQVINILDCSMGHPLQSSNSLLVGIVGCIGPIILDTPSVLSRLNPEWGGSLDQGSSTKMYEAP